MGRRHRTDIDGGWYHVMNRGVDRQQIFFAETDRVDFGRLLGVGWERLGVEVHAYCLMSNHFHLLLHCPTKGLSSYMHDLQSTYTRHVNDRLGRDGPLFRGRFRSIQVDTDAYLRAAVRYIHRNPLDIPSVDAVDDYRWSSHRTYLGHRRRPGWVRTDFVLEMFGGDIAAFDHFVRSDEAGLENVGLEQLDSLIELIVDERLPGALESNRAACKAVSMLLLDRVEGQLHSQLEATLAFPSAGARRTAMSRARQLACSDPTVADIARRVQRLVA